MPELPEVETIARNLATQIQGRRIVAIEKLDWERMIETPEPPCFVSLLSGQTIFGTARRAKWLLLRLDAPWTLAIHLRMSGRIGVYDVEAVPDVHTHLVIALDNSQRIFFRDPRKFGRVRLLDSQGLQTLDRAFGVEPLSLAFTAEKLAHVLSQRRSRIKPLLLNQSLIAGLGNIYVDESLWTAQLHPLRQAYTLRNDEIAQLYQSIRNVLEQSLAFGGSTLRDYRNGYGKVGHNQEYFSVYGRQGKPCPRCGTIIERIVIAQRGTHLCPKCQIYPTPTATPFNR